MRSSSSGFLLLLLGAIGLIGFLTGNLDRWLAYLFSAGTATVPVASFGPSNPASGYPTSTTGGDRRGGGAVA